jgi:hypothetical protein
MSEEWKEVYLSIQWRGWKIEFHEGHVTATAPEHYVTPGHHLGISTHVWDDEANEALPMKRFPEILKRVLIFVDNILKTEETNRDRSLNREG